LDSEAKPEDAIAAQDGEDTIAAEEEGEIVIAIEGEEPEPDPDAEVEAELGEAGKRALKAAREAAKEAAREAREAKAKLAEIEAANRPKEEEIPRPTLEECGFNEDAFAEKMAAYVASQEKVKAKKAEEDARQKADAEAYQAKLDRYNAERTKVGADDDAQAKVVAALDARQQSALMHTSDNAAVVVAALAKTPKALAELAAIKDPLLFVRKLAHIEGRISMTKAPPPPETKLRGGVAAPSASFQSRLDAAEKAAERTGDRTEVIRIRREMKAAQAAS
jgi:dTMP kinase